jgi:hypothetical protein
VAFPGAVAATDDDDDEAGPVLLQAGLPTDDDAEAGSDGDGPDTRDVIRPTPGSAVPPATGTPPEETGG